MPRPDQHVPPLPTDIPIVPIVNAEAKPFSPRSMSRFEMWLRGVAGRDVRWAMWLCDLLERTVWRG